MSGSKSSVPADTARPEPIALTVHALPEPRLDDARRRRVIGGRLRMLLVLLACAAPVLASYFTYYVIRPEGRTNYGTLVSPPQPLPTALALQSLDGRAVDPATLRGQWLLITVSDARCDAGCEGRIYMQRQLREMLGRERDRLDRIWFLTGEGTPPQALLDAANLTPGLTVLRADRAALAAWLRPADGHQLEEHLYIVDPMGHWMMRAPVDPEPARLKRDLDRLLRASSSWDRAGH